MTDREVAIASLDVGDRDMTVASQVKTTVSSQLFPMLFDRLDEDRCLTVFDTGLASPETVNFFGQFKCRLHFTDLYSEPVVHQQGDECSEQELLEQFQELLNFPAGTQFDICLFWDFLNYLKAPAVRAFSAAIQPYIHKQTRAHGFAVRNSNTVLPNQCYGVVERETLSNWSRHGEPLASYPHPQTELNKLLSCFEIGRGTLLADGRLEVLLKTINL